MSNISKASKIAIHFIRPFRAYLDGFSLIKNRRAMLENSLRMRLEVVLEEFNLYNPHASQEQLDYRNAFFSDISKMVLDRYEKSYDDVLPKMIDSLTTSIENELKNNFTEDELEQLEVILSNEVTQKLIAQDSIFSLLKNCELQMDYEIQGQMFDAMLDGENSQKLQQILSDLKQKYSQNKDNYGYDQFYDEDEDGESWDQNK